MEPIQINSPAHLALQISQQMNDHGWAMLGLEFEGLLYHFTVGLEYNYGHPNLEVFGLEDAYGKSLLTVLVSYIQSGRKLTNGDFFSELVNGYDLLLVENPQNPEGPPITGGRLRLVWPDVNHKFPWDEGCDPRCHAQKSIPPATGIDLEHIHLIFEAQNELA